MKLKFRDIVETSPILGSLLDLPITALGVPMTLRLGEAARTIGERGREWASLQDRLCRDFKVPKKAIPGGESWDFDKMAADTPEPFKSFWEKREEYLDTEVEVEVKPIWIEDLTPEQMKVIRGVHIAYLPYIFKSKG